jgi:putative membrane protein
MVLVSEVAVVFVAMLHGCYLVLEMFLWDKPAGLKAFGQTKEQANLTKVLAANQGLYNGFIAAGLTYGVFQGAAGFDFSMVPKGSQSQFVPVNRDRRINVAFPNSKKEIP